MKRRGFAIFFTLIGVVFFFAIAGIFLLYLLVGRGPVIPSSARLTLEIGGELAEVEPADVVTYLSGGRVPTVSGIVDNLRKARVDDRVRSVLLKPTGLTTPFWGKIQEIRDAVVDFKKSGKPVYAYLEYGGDRDYYLASAADKVFLMPSSTLDVTGVATYELFLRGTLDSVGVVADLEHVGKYKTGSNTFTEKGFTPAHREMDASLNRDLYDQIVDGIAGGRKKSQDEIRRLLDQGPFLPEEAVRAGLIDELAYEDQVTGKLEDANAGARDLDGVDYGHVSSRSLGLNRGPRIAVIYAAGTIASGRSGYDPVQGAILGSETLIQYIRRARDDRSVRAIVLRIDSPGGSAAASDAIWRELMITRQERSDRPIVASMSDLAASGGYYIAMPSQTIVAQPSTLTGSIGIFGGKFATGGLYEKLGARTDSVSDGKNAEINSPLRPYNVDERKEVRDQLQAFYDQFVEKVAESRGSTPEKIDQLAQGRVWTGRQAKGNGLVDELGGLAAAVTIAKRHAKIEESSDVELVVYPPAKSFYELLADQLAGATGQVRVGSWLAAYLSKGEIEMLRAVHGPFAIFRRGEPLALMPFTFLR